jgi:hypothetical protein
VFPLERARDVIAMYGDYAATAPDELYIDPGIMTRPGGKGGTAFVEICYSGDMKNAEAALAPIRKLGTPASGEFKTTDYLDAQRANDSGDNRDIASYLKAGFIPKFSPELVSAIVDGIPRDAQCTSVLFFQHGGGAANRVAENATAFAQRDSLANMMAVGVWRTADDARPHMDVTRKYWSTLEPFTRGFYVNDMSREASAAQINANYRGNYARLVRIKKQYDPTNLFRLNANVQPG